MTYTLDIDLVARAQIRELLPSGVVALAGALAVLELVPERGEPLGPVGADGSDGSSLAVAKRLNSAGGSRLPRRVAAGQPKQLVER